ncbi:MAG: carboxypeptidase regulatory-like domain-containing protein [Acidobacteriaceae bacterium]|jgi:plastocyanin|nr:carboxypeptidase regulatory-like domain-containing protein [Acidobacteriaceae bacterium]
MRVEGAILLGLLLGASGCKTDQAARQAENMDKREPPAVAALDPAMTGTLAGVITFKGKAPAKLRIDMNADPACNKGGGENDVEQYAVNKKGGLANVYVYVKSGLPPNVKFPPKTDVVVLDQKHCRYEPHVVAVQVGEPVEFRNSDATMHNVHTLPKMVGNSAADLSEPPMSPPQRQSYSQPEEMLPVGCNNHPWMSAFINVSASPFFAVTGADGKFEIHGLPPGIYTIVAVHEKMGEVAQQVTIATQVTSRANFTFPQ